MTNEKTFEHSIVFYFNFAPQDARPQLWREKSRVVFKSSLRWPRGTRSGPLSLGACYASSYQT